MLKTGLTGGIGSGKTLAGKIFSTLGVPVYQADAAVKRLYDTDENLRNGLIALFGENIYGSSGKLDRSKLAGIIFSDRESLNKINALVHPVAIDDFNRFVASLPKDVPYVIHESAILYEAKIDKFFDRIINVYAPEDLRIMRSVARGENENDVRRRIAAQLPDKYKLDLADHNIINDDKTLILPQILKIHNELSNIFRPDCQSFENIV